MKTRTFLIILIFIVSIMVSLNWITMKTIFGQESTITDQVKDCIISETKRDIKAWNHSDTIPDNIIIDCISFISNNNNKSIYYKKSNRFKEKSILFEVREKLRENKSVDIELTKFLYDKLYITNKVKFNKDVNFTKDQELIYEHVLNCLHNKGLESKDSNLNYFKLWNYLYYPTIKIDLAINNDDLTQENPVVYIEVLNYSKYASSIYYLYNTNELFELNNALKQMIFEAVIVKIE